MPPSDPEDTFRVVDRRRRAGADEPAPPTAPPEPDDEPDLTGLFVMLANAAVGALQHDAAQAAEFVDILVLLRRKTEGHRTAEENRMLDEVLTELQARYAEATKRTG